MYDTDLFTYKQQLVMDKSFFATLYMVENNASTL